MNAIKIYWLTHHSVLEGERT